MKITPLSETRKESLRYIADMSRELAQQAEANRFPCVTYFLQMAYSEAYDVLRGHRSAVPEAQISTPDARERLSVL